MRRLLATVGLGLSLSGSLQAQGPGFQLAHLFTDPSATMYRLDFASNLVSPFGIAPAALVIDGGKGFGNLWGGGLDVSLFRSNRRGLYAIGGLDLGVVTNGGRTFWSSWSAGPGYELFPIGGLSLAAEARYRWIHPRDYNGLQLGIRLGLDRSSKHSGGSSGGGSSETTNASTVAPSNTPPDSAEVRKDLSGAGVAPERANVIGSVVQTAIDVMGMPYRWGDEGEEGFDCSGLIRYAFGKQGISLPRRSRDQAREGAAVAKNLDALQAGDILTFSTSGGSTVSHVGLYVGNGKFIHSARQGVQMSVLSPDDVSGRWWWRRWVGARRVVK